MCICLLLTGVNPYYQAAMDRALNPYRPRTMCNYRRQLHLFVCFSIRTKAPVVLPVENLISFLEFLASCHVSPRSICNYVSGIKSYLAVYQHPVQWLDHSMIRNYLRSLQLNVPTVHRLKDTITLQDFYNISVLLQQFDHPLVYRAAFALSFYGFLRISNLVPSSKKSSDATRQLTKGDVTFTPHGVRLFIKWAKNLQKTQQSQVILLPIMSNSLLSPYHILHSLFSSQHYSHTDPVIKNSEGPLCEVHLRKRLHLILNMLGLPTASLTYHSLRRSGASLAFNNRVDFKAIKAQGVWNSDSVYKYLFANSETMQQVPRMFQALESTVLFGGSLCT